MISSDDHSPPDPSSSDYHNQQSSDHDLKINSDEQAHASVSDIDLLLKSLADDTNNPLPSFSIRDYVFNSRSKDIACNWPFSHKTLQIGLQNGVKNLLPPFQSLELLRNNSSAENRPSYEIVNSSHGKPIVDEFVSVTPYATNSNPGLTLESVNTISSGSKRDNKHLQEDLTRTKSTKTPLVSSRKTENTTIQTTIKKCRLGAKLTTCVERVEEVTPNNFTVSETMASKVCPVCKTFSSSSNTTLNAHIDQCLSGESSMKWTTKPKVIAKHRIKPRKTRLMVDIYKTAPHCTVEELDARNGTSWANNSSFPAQELEFQGEEEHRTTTVVPEVADHEGAVYIDTNGTKVRILSVPKADPSGDHGARNLLKGGKLNKSFTGKMKNKDHEHKHQQKYLKLSPNGKKLCSPKPPRGPSSEVTTGREENVAIGESCNKEDHGKEPTNPEVHTKLDDLPIVRPPWACSKRTGLAKKSCGNFHSRHNVPKNLSVASSSNDMSSQQKSLKMGPSAGHYAKKRSPLLTKPNSSHLKKEGTLLHNRCEDPSDAIPSKRSKGSDFRSKSSKLSSLGKNVAVSREPASKSNLKRKFSAVKRSCIHPLSKENVVVGPSQDSLKQQSRVEEDDTSGKTSSESMNLLDVRKKPENSVASRSSNGDSSAWMKNDMVDPLCDVDSVRKETRSHRGIDVEGSRSMVSLNPDNVFDSQERNELYQDDQLCSPKHDKEMYCADVNEKSMHIDDIERQHDYFDPIPLPGLPGSFLPSPGRDMVSEELQGNSSLATMSRVQSSDDRHHHDSMSDSPISTISNPSLARSDSDKFSVRSTSLKDDTKGFSGAMVDAINGGDWRSVKNDHQPCCCSRKEQTVASSYHESTFLRKHAVEPLNFRPQMLSVSNYRTNSQAPLGTMASPTMKVPAYSECDSVGSPSKPVLRLMGKNLTVVKTDEDVSFSSQQFRPPPQLSPMSQFSNVQNEYNFSSIGYLPQNQNPIIFNQNQNGFKSQHPRNTMFQSIRYADCYGNGSPYLSPMIPQSPSRKEIIVINDDSPEDEAGHDMRRNWSSLSSSIPGHNRMPSGYQSLPFSNGSFQSFPSNFMEVPNNSKWKCTPAGSSRPLSPSTSHPATYYPPSFS